MRAMLSGQNILLEAANHNRTIRAIILGTLLLGKLARGLSVADAVGNAVRLLACQGLGPVGKIKHGKKRSPFLLLWTCSVSLAPSTGKA